MSFDTTATGLVMIEDETYYISSVPKQQKLITKHRKAAKMIGNLLSEKKQYKDVIVTLSNAVAKLGNDYSKIKYENDKLKEKIKEDNKIYKEFLIEKFKLQGEIRVLERTIDKLIEARK